MRPEASYNDDYDFTPPPSPAWDEEYDEKETAKNELHGRSLMDDIDDRIDHEYAVERFPGVTAQMTSRFRVIPEE